MQLDKLTGGKTNKVKKDVLLYIFIANLIFFSSLFSKSIHPERGYLQQNGRPSCNILLISWDGCDRSILKEMFDTGKLVSLSEVSRQGSYQEIEVIGHLTLTKPAHAVMLTGVEPSVTGVISNLKYQPIPEGLTIFERAQSFFGPANIRTIMVASKVAHVGGRSPEEARAWLQQRLSRRGALTIPAGADDTSPQASQAEPFYLTRRHLDVFDVEQRKADETGQLCLKCLEKYKKEPFLAFFHFADPDNAGHAWGMRSLQYRQAIQSCDRILGDILRWLKQNRLFDKTLIYVTTDHGFDDEGFTHLQATRGWLVTNDPKVKRGGILADIPATILNRFGIDETCLEPKLMGISLTRNIPQDRPIPPVPSWTELPEGQLRPKLKKRYQLTYLPNFHPLPYFGQR